MTTEETQTGLEISNFNQLKVSLLGFIGSKFKVCDSFKQEYDACLNETMLYKLFCKYNDDVYERLGGEPELQDEVNELERDVKRLEREVDNLESELEDVKIEYGTTMDDVYKREYIEQYYNDYTPWEMEELFKNGKKYLSK